MGVVLRTEQERKKNGSEIFIELKGVDHAGNKTQRTENPTVGLTVTLRLS